MLYQSEARWVDLLRFVEADLENVMAPQIGYVASFSALQFAMMILIEYVCSDGHRIKCRQDFIDWQDPKMVWQ